MPRRDVLRGLRQEPAAQRLLKKLETVQKIFEAGQITLVLDAAKIAPFDLIREATKIRETTPPAAAAPQETPEQTGTARRSDPMSPTAIHNDAISGDLRGPEYEDTLDPAKPVLAEALRKSFRILKFLMLVLVVLYFLSGWFSVKPAMSA